MEEKYIGISDDKLHHIISVARKAYILAKDMGYDETFARRMFMLGWNHDIGYEFSEKQSEHPELSANMCLNLLSNSTDKSIMIDSYRAIKNHGSYTEHKSIEWKILNMADMLVDSKGNFVTAIERLDDIKTRYGRYSDQYLTACDICHQIGLTDVNIANI